MTRSIFPVRFEEAKCHMEPSDSWDEFGPPARRMRWCCHVHKSVPTILKLRELTGFYNTKAVVYDGVRAEESARRSSYDEVVVGVKNISQVNVHPILKWNTAEVYCYLLKNKIFFNSAYRIGLFRVGCMVCPMSSEWWEGIANTVYQEEMSPLIEKVEAFAVRAKSPTEAKKYVEAGGWKARVGGKGLINGGNRVKEKIENDSIVFSIHGYRQRWEEVAKLLGVIVEDDGKKAIQRIGKQYFEFRTIYEDDILSLTGQKESAFCTVETVLTSRLIWTEALRKNIYVLALKTSLLLLEWPWP